MTDHYRRSNINPYSNNSGILNYLDPNTMNSQSHLPQPPSTLRSKNSKRLSMASATRTSIIGTARNNIVNEFSNKRKSILSTPAPTKRQQRLSYAPQFSQQSSTLQATPGFQLPASSAVSQKDPRPIRDKGYQTSIQQEIYDYLSNNKFELEMNHPLTTKTLKIPTQKDFVLIFQFLYRKIDPSYRFTKSIEHEVFLLLKTINYPYLDGINKSQISAVGGQNWPVFLGMLYWLVKLNNQLEKCDNDDLISPDDQLDQLFIDYIRKSYKAFIANEDDYSEYHNELKVKFDEVSEDLIKNIDSMKIKQAELEKEYRQIYETSEVFANAERKSEALETDLIKFKAYIETMESRKLKWSTLLSEIKREIEICEEKLKEVKIEKEHTEQQIKSQGLLPDDIDKLNDEREKYSKNIDNTNIKLKERKEVLRSKELEADKALESLEILISAYNNQVIRLKSSNILMAETELTAGSEYDFEIDLNRSIMDEIDKSGIKPDQILGRSLKNEKIRLLQFRTKIKSNIHKISSDFIKIQEQLESISDKIREKNVELDSMNAKFSTGKNTYDEIYETMNNETTRSTTQIEKLERDLKEIKISSSEDFSKVEDQSQSVKYEHDKLRRKISKEREILHDKIGQVIEFVTNFKVHIQLNSEMFENFILGECKKEFED